MQTARLRNNAIKRRGINRSIQGRKSGNRGTELNFLISRNYSLSINYILHADISWNLMRFSDPTAMKSELFVLTEIYLRLGKLH
jgi:hypothetical protein